MWKESHKAIYILNLRFGCELTKLGMYCVTKLSVLSILKSSVEDVPTSWTCDPSDVGVLDHRGVLYNMTYLNDDGILKD
jgi:hypothetical protein